MNENLKKRNSHLTGNGLRLWGTILLIVGIVGQSILQNSMLGLNKLTGNELLAAMQASEDVMAMATVALVCQVIYTCAAPIYAFLLLEGFQHTKSFGKYFLRVLAVAVASEIPYNLAMSGNVLDMSSRNPAFGLVLCLAVLYFYRRYADKGIKNLAIKAVVTVSALLWAFMLSISDGACMVVLVAAMWALRNLKTGRTIFSCTAAFACSVFSPYYMGAPLAFLAIHFYDGEKGKDNRIFNYLSFPMILLVCWLAGKVM